jgi:uncharacterized protein
MLTQQQLANRIEAIRPTLKQKYFVDKIGYFGSYSDGTATEKSDIDILVSFTQPVGYEFFGVQDMLENVLGLKVDLVTDKAIRPQLRAYIYNNLKPL